MKKIALTDEEKREIIKYGQERFKVIFLFFLYIMFIGIILDVFLEGMIFWISFCSIRRYAGGYHADTQRKCCIISGSAIILIFLFLKYIAENILIAGVLQGVGYVVIMMLAPVDNKNRILNDVEKKDFQKKTLVVATSLIIISWYIYQNGYTCMLMPISIAYVLLAVLLLAGKYKNITEKSGKTMNKGLGTNTTSGY